MSEEPRRLPMVLALLVAVGCGYGLAQLEGESGASPPPLSVVCAASLGSLDRLAGPGAPTSATTLQAEVTVLSQQRLRVDDAGDQADASLLAVGSALDEALLLLADVPRGGAVDPAALDPAVREYLSGLRRACATP